MKSHDKPMNRVVKIWGYQFYLKEFIILFFSYLLMENIFSWLVLPVSTMILLFEKISSLIIFGFVLFNYANLKRNEKIYTGLFCFLILKLVFESILRFGNFFEQFTLFSVLFPIIFTIYIKCISRSLDLDLLEFLAKFYIGVYIVTMIIYGRGFSFSLESVTMTDYGPFSGDSRIIHARSIFMMIIPLLWYLDKFLKNFQLKHFLLFGFCLVVILIHQHRSVWASSIFSVVIYLFATFRNRLIPIPRLLNVIIISLLIIFILSFVMVHIAPQFADLLSDRFSEILDPSREGGTGKFRADQREVYLALFLKRPVFGWTFDGFNMANPLVDWWPAKSGQHFHEGYVEMLFYHGIAGFFLKYWFLFYLSFKAFSKKLSKESVILIAFALSGFLFSFSYVLPLIFWGHVGLCLYYLEKNPEELLTDEGFEFSIDEMSNPRTLLPDHATIDEHN